MFIYELTHAQIWTEYSSFYPAVGLQIGSSGLGLQGAYPLSPEFNFRAGGNFVPSVKLKHNNQFFELKRSNAELFFDWQPLYGGESWISRKWILSVGASYFFYNKAVVYVGSENSDEQPIDYTVEWSQFRPYVGTGLNGIRIAYHFNLAVNAGYFIPTSETKIVPYAKDPSGISHIRDRLNSFPNNILPGMQLQVGLNYIFF